MASQSQATVQDVLQIISDLRGESNVNTNADRIRAVARAYRDFALRKLWRIYLLRNQTTVGDGTGNLTIGSATYPMRTKGLAELFVGTGTGEENRYATVDFNGFKDIVNRNNAARIAYEWFDATNNLWKVAINPAPAVGATVTYSYFWEPPTVTTTTDVITAPSLRIIALLASGDIYMNEDEVQKALLVKNEAEQIIEDFEGIDNEPANNQLYAQAAIESLGNRRGIGSY